ncbi:hypothetical protein [Kineosporia sp. NBRC 101731]|uniref:hypothetical protein n=1 Tax=Kineosporia sp. NBRC 101731 TaxID=3032199 RepID=UPI0024A24F01|nr:hypothetical protein [Kineosporia sp. NBRC 101731]GLY31897.1 hypothetical protein Kisp02_52620 [Kineosporia sp. NBRC 101731]
MDMGLDSGPEEIDLAVMTTHGEASHVRARVKEPDSVEFWYAEILHGVVPRPWLHAWATSRPPRAVTRFDGVVLSSGPLGQVLLSIPPEVVDHALTDDEVGLLLKGLP